MADTSLVDGVAGNFTLEESLERSANACDNSQYVYFIGDLASHCMEGYTAMLSAKVGLGEWNNLLDALVSGDAAVIAARATTAAAQLAKVSEAPTKTASAFGQVWATCPTKLDRVRELQQVLECLHAEGEFPAKVRENPLYNVAHVLKALALTMFSRSVTTAEAQLKTKGGDLTKYAVHIYSAATWAKFTTLDSEQQGWLRINVAAAVRQTSNIDVQTIETAIKQLLKSC